jgi:hypothetical protein
VIPQPQVPPAAAAAPLTTANFGSVAGPTAAAILASAVADNGLEILSSASSRSNRAGIQSAVPSNLALWAIKSIRPGRERAQAITPIAQACPFGGTLSGNMNDADNNEDISAGDTITITGSNCVTESGGLAINGGLTIRVNSIAFDTVGDVTNASLSMSFSNFTSAGNTLNGAVTVSISGNTVTTAYENFSNSRPGVAASLLNFTSVISTTGTLAINGIITTNDNTYTLTTTSPLIFGSQYPIGGTLRVTDASGGRVDLISSNVSGGFLDCDLFLPGDSVRDGRISTAWSAL